MRDDNDNYVTERPSRVGMKHFASRSLGLGFRSQRLLPAILTEDFCIFGSASPGKCVQNISNFSASIRIIPRSLHTNHHFMCVISGPRRVIDDISAVLGYCAAYICNSFPTFGTAYRSHFLGYLDILALEDETDRFVPIRR
jgi:hypothetical protein